MEFMVLLLALSTYAMTVRSSLDELPVHPGVGGFYKGPNSETIIKGPDGSVITVEAQGGSILAAPDATPILVEEPANLQTVTPVADVITVSDEVSSAIKTVDAPASLSIAPASDIGHAVEIIRPDPHLIETELVDAPLVEPQEATDLVGPSGSISTRGSSSVVSGPASTTISEPARVVVATPLVAAVPVIASGKTPLRSVPVVELTPDYPPPVNSFVLQASPAPTVTLTPLGNEVSVSPEISGSTSSSLILSSVPPVHSVAELASTERPTVLVSTPVPGLLSSTISSNAINPQQQPVATVESASSFGVIENRVNQISSTTRPALSIGTTLSPSTLPEFDRNSLNYAIVNSGQLSINPSLIPTANIIPPEIGLNSKRAKQLEPMDNPIASTEVPLVNVETGNRGHVDAIAVQNQATGVGQSSVQIISNNPRIPSNGLLASGLAKYGIDSRQINVAQVPLSSTIRLSPNSPVPVSFEQELEDVSDKFSNRYGRTIPKEDKQNNENI